MRKFNKGKEMYRCDIERMVGKIQTFSRFGDAGNGGITRYTLSPDDIDARKEFQKRMEAEGATILLNAVLKADKS